MKERKTEGGSGGKRGHSNMCHWDYTEEIKREANKRRRQQDKQIINNWLQDEQIGRKKI